MSAAQRGYLSVAAARRGRNASPLGVDGRGMGESLELMLMLILMASWALPAKAGMKYTTSKVPAHRTSWKLERALALEPITFWQSRYSFTTVLNKAWTEALKNGPNILDGCTKS